jgi:hypothetical protein
VNNLDEFHKMLTANPDIESIIGAVLRDIFYTSYERAFGQPSADIRAKVDQADAQTIAEWLPNFVRVRNSTDLFVSSLEHAIAKYGASLLARNFGIETGPVHGMSDVLEVLQRQPSNAQRIAEDQPTPDGGG